MTDPKRLIDPESRSSPTLRTLLRAGRAELPTDESIEAIGVRLGIVAGFPAGGTPHGPSAAPDMGARIAASGMKVGAAAKIGAVALVALGGVGGTYVLTSSGQRATTSHPTPSAASPASTAATPRQLPTPSKAAAHEPEPSPQAANSQSSGAVDVGTPLRVGAPESEVALLESAEDGLASNPENALSLAERHAARFPRGELAQEREMIAIEALVRLHRLAAARSRVDRFYRVFPRSAYRTRIENLLGSDSFHNP